MLRALFSQSVKNPYFCGGPISADPVCPQPRCYGVLPPHATLQVIMILLLIIIIVITVITINIIIIIIINMFIIIIIGLYAPGERGAPRVRVSRPYTNHNTTNNNNNTNDDNDDHNNNNTNNMNNVNNDDNKQKQ